jgi:SAM-dependent methyltransferase
MPSPMDGRSPGSEAPPEAPPTPEDQVLELLGELPRELFPPSFVASVAAIEGYAGAWAVELARRLGLGAPLAAGATAGELVGRLGFVPAFRPALAWVLDRLAAAGLLSAEEAAGGTRYRLAGALPDPERESWRRQALTADPANAPALALFDAAGDACPAIARGEISGEEVLLGPAGSGLWARYFDNANPTYAINNAIAAIAAANRLPGARAAVLEVGAGGGSSSEALLAELERRGAGGRLASFRVTEPSPFFRRRCERSLRRAFPALPLAFGDLDVDQPWGAQGIAPGSVDLVFGVNVLHVARDLAATLGEALAALAPGGWLVAGECLRPFPGQSLSAELVFRLLGDFNDVETDPVCRPNPGFLTPEQWRRSLERAGFEAVDTVPDLVRIRQVDRRFSAGAVCGRRPSGGEPV